MTIPVKGLFGGIRVDAMFEDYERDDEGTEGLRRRVRATALRDLTREVKAALKRYNLDNTGNPRDGDRTRWA